MGAFGEFPLEDNIATLYQGGENCRANAAYIFTQFGDNLLHERVRKTTGPVRTNQWERRKVSNLQGELGLAEEHHRAVAIPRGDCNTQQHHPSARNITDELEKV